MAMMIIMRKLIEERRRGNRKTVSGYWSVWYGMTDSIRLVLNILPISYTWICWSVLLLQVSSTTPIALPLLIWVNGAQLLREIIDFLWTHNCHGNDHDCVICWWCWWEARPPESIKSAYTHNTDNITHVSMHASRSKITEKFLTPWGMIDQCSFPYTLIIFSKCNNLMGPYTKSYKKNQIQTDKVSRVSILLREQNMLTKFSFLNTPWLHSVWSLFHNTAGVPSTCSHFPLCSPHTNIYSPLKLTLWFSTPFYTFTIISPPGGCFY